MHVPIHDVLDDFNFIASELLKAKPSYLFAAGDTIIPSYLGGQIRDIYPSEYNFYTLLNVFAPMELAYAVNDLLTRIVAYLGMFLLIRKVEKSKDQNGLIPHFVACSFALLPFWPSFGLAVSGSPLIAWAFLNLITENKTKTSLFIVCSYPFYSHFIFGGVFMIFMGGFILGSRLLFKRKLSLYLLLGLTLMTILSILVNYRLFRLEFFTDFESHRSLWPSAEQNFLYSLRKVAKYIVVGQYHAASLHFPIIITTGLLFALYYCRKGIPREIITVIMCIILTAILAGFYRWEVIETLKVHYFPFLLSIQLDRIYFLVPFLAHLLFGQILIFMFKNGGLARNCSYCLLCFQLVVVCKQHPEILAYQDSSVECTGTARCNNLPSLKQFIAPELFDDIKRDINLPLGSFRVASFGLHPSIAAMNGLQTIDGYMNIYSINYKMDFEALIRPELDKSPELDKYFSEWGSRAYLFSSELGNTWNVYSKNDRIEVNNLELNMKAFEKLGGRFIISTIPITGKVENLFFVDHYTNDSAFWKLYLYEYNAVGF